MIKKSILFTSIASALAFMASGVTFAQDADDEDDLVMEEVIVTGVKYSMTAAVEIKKQSMEIVDSIVAEDLGKFPDNNVVEAMQRIPGVQTTNRGAGEVSSISIRGLSDVTTTVNGRNIFTTSGRSVALADIPATLVNRVDVYKTRSPDQISRGLAGQIDIHTNRPFDFDGFAFLAQARGIYMEQTEETDPNVGLLISNRWETDLGEFGALLNVSYAKTNWLDQGVHAGASVLFRPPDDPNAPLERLFPPLWPAGLDEGMPFAEGSTLDDGTPYVHSRDAVFQPHVRGERERPAWNLSFQWAPNDWSTYTAEAFYNGYENTQHNSLFFTFVDWWGSVDPADPVEIYPGTNIVASRYVNFPYSFVSGDNLSQETDTYLYALGGEWDFTDDLTVKSEFVYQESEFTDEFFALRMDHVFPRLFIDFNQGNGVPYLEFFDDPNTPVDDSDLTNPELWAFAELYDNQQKDKGDALTFTLDADLAVEWGPINTISFGTRFDDRGAEENGYQSGDVYCGNVPTCAGLTQADFPGLMGVTTNHFDGQANVLSSWGIPSSSGLFANQAAMRAAWGYLPPNERVFINEFNIDETQIALYAQADFAIDLSNGGFLDGRFGLRYLDQETDISFTNPEGGISTATNSNDTILPSLMVRWGITENLVARFAYTEVFELPSFPQMNPYIVYNADVTNIGYGTGSGGNADLEPIESQNTDISLEWYFMEGGVLYGTWFRRDITNNIIGYRNLVQYDDPNDNPDRGLYDYIVSQPDNAGESTLDGWEFGLTYFPELPGILNGLGFQGSYTILDSEQTNPILDEQGDITGYRTTPLLGVSDSSYSAILAYDRETFSMRLSYFWRESFHDRDEAALFANPLAIWKSDEESLDFQVTWSPFENWTFEFDATNLTDPIFSENYGDNPMVFNFLNSYYSKTYAVGVRYQFR